MALGSRPVPQDFGRPPVDRANNGQGDETPRTLVLGILKEAGDAGLTVKELRYELNSRLTGHRGQGTHVSRRTVQRWLKAWTSVGLVGSHSSRPSTQRGRPEPLFVVLSSICEGNPVVNTGENAEIAVPASDRINDRGLALNTPEAECVVNSELAEHETHATEERHAVLGKESTKSPLSPSGEQIPRINDTSDAREAVSLIHEAETLSSAGVSEIGPGINDTRAQVKRARPPRFTEGDWDAVRWG